MNKKDLRIVFMGTPDFAVESLKILVENGYNIAGVITMPDKPAGRGHKIQFSAVKKYALENNLNLLQPEKLKNDEFIGELRALNADLQIVVAFRMLPGIVWDMPRFGTFNLHASLLPQYRGAAPINWAIINGEPETGITTFFLTHEIDTGKIILQKKINIGKNDNAGIVHDRLMKDGAILVKQTVDLLLEDKIETTAQEQLIPKNDSLRAAPKIFKETCKVDWNQPSENIYNLIRGLSPYPTAWTELHVPDKVAHIVKIYSAEIIDKQTEDAPGAIDTDNKNYIYVKTGDGFLKLSELQLAGKKAMKTEELLRGFKFEDNSRFV